MYCSVLSATVSGMEMIPVQVEADVSDGMPQFTMVGYVSAQVKEAQDRVRTALKNMGISLPPKRITINLSPADVRKEGSRFDLPIAAGVLMTLGRIPPGSLRKTMVLGESAFSANSALTAMCRRSAVYFRQRRRRGSLDAQRFLFRPEMPRKGVWSAGFTSLESRIYRSF